MNSLNADTHILTYINIIHIFNLSLLLYIHLCSNQYPSHMNKTYHQWHYLTYKSTVITIIIIIMNQIELQQHTHTFIYPHTWLPRCISIYHILYMYDTLVYAILIRIIIYEWVECARAHSLSACLLSLLDFQDKLFFMRCDAMSNIQTNKMSFAIPTVSTESLALQKHTQRNLIISK